MSQHFNFDHLINFDSALLHPRADMTPPGSSSGGDSGCPPNMICIDKLQPHNPFIVHHDPVVIVVLVVTYALTFGVGVLAGLARARGRVQ
jgi:hypothetical protein